MKRLFIDIETIPGQKEWIKEEAAEKVSPPGNYKKKESIDKWMEENAEKEADNLWRKTALDGSRGEIFCIGYSVDGAGVKVEREATEAETLHAFFNSLLEHDMNFKWVGHNISGFDLRFIWQRCVINKVKPPVKIPYSAKPWDADIFDTMVEWAGIKPAGTKSLSDVCKAIGVDGKGDIDGSKVWDYVKDGRYAEVDAYCMDDVSKVIKLHNMMTFED